MADACVIGVDLGGTKLLAGAVDAQLRRAPPRLPACRGPTRPSSLRRRSSTAVEEVRAGRSTAEVARGRLRHPVPVRPAHGGDGRATVTSPLVDVPFARPDGRAARAAGRRRQRRQLRRCSPSARHGAARGARDVVHAHARAPAIGGGLLARRRGSTAARRARPPSSGTWSSTPTARRARATARTAAAWRRSPRARRSRARAAARRAAAPDTALGRALRGGPRAHRRRSSPSSPTTATRSRASAIATIGRALGVGHRQPREHLQPARSIVIGGGVIAAGELLLAPAREVMRERALAPAADRCGSSRRASAPRRACSAPRRWPSTGSARRALGERDDDRDGRLVVCPTPIGNLEDVTLRVLAALREADVVACEDTRRTRCCSTATASRPSSSRYHEHNERARARRAGRADARRRRSSRWSATPGMPLVSDPGFVLVQACVAAGLAVEVLPGPSAALAALVASGAAGRRVALRRLPAAQARRARGGLRASPETLVAFESPRRVGASLRGRSPTLDPERPVARLPRADQAPRGGRARARRPSSPSATRTPRPRGEVVLVVGGRRRGRRSSRPAVDAVRRLVDAGARPRPAAGGRGRAHRRERERAVPGADCAGAVATLQRSTRDRARPAGARLRCRACHLHAPGSSSCSCRSRSCCWRSCSRARRPPPPRERWRWPLHGDVVGAFRYAPARTRSRPARGAASTSRPRAVRPCARRAPGRVTFAGPVPGGRGLGVTVRCGALVATYLGLGRWRSAAGRGSRPAPGSASSGPPRRLRLGARRAVGRASATSTRSACSARCHRRSRRGPGPRAAGARAARPARSAARRRRPPPRARARARRRRRAARRAAASPGLAWVGLVLARRRAAAGGLGAGARRRRAARAPRGGRGDERAPATSPRGSRCRRRS